MVESWDLDGSPEAFLKAFTAWPKGLYPGSRDLVASLDGRVRVACLSNTNRLHAGLEWSGGGITEIFETCFLSHETGLVKPDRDAFDHAVAGLGCGSDSVLFLDDNIINVEAARATRRKRSGARGSSRGPHVLRAHHKLKRTLGF